MIEITALMQQTNEVAKFSMLPKTLLCKCLGCKR